MKSFFEALLERTWSAVAASEPPSLEEVSFSAENNVSSASANDSPVFSVRTSSLKPQVQTSNGDGDSHLPTLALTPLSFDPRPWQYGEEEALRRDRGTVEEAAYISDAKGLRYMSLSAIMKVGMHHLLKSFYSVAATRSTRETQVAAGCTAYLPLVTGNEGEWRWGLSLFQPYSTDNKASFLEDCYGQLAACTLRQNKNVCPTADLVSQDAQSPAVTHGCAGGFSETPPDRRQSEFSCVQLETPSCFCRSFPAVLRKLCAWRESAGDESFNRSSTSSQDAFAEAISLEKLALLDAGVYVRPDLSEILVSRREEANEVRAMLKRCRDIDVRISGLKKKACLRKRLPRNQPTSKNPSGADGDNASKSADGGNDGQHGVADVINNPVTAERGTDTRSIDTETATTGGLLRTVRSSSVRSEEQPRGICTDASYAVAASAEIVALGREKLRLRRRLADVRALHEYVWKCGGLSINSHINADQFSRLFCSNEEDVSQQRAASVLFELCDADHRGRVTLEDVYSRLPLRALEVMFIVSEMERKARQVYRYYWI